MFSARLCLHIFEAHRIKPPRPTSAHFATPLCTSQANFACHNYPLNTLNAKYYSFPGTHTHFVIKLNRKHFKSTHTAKPRCCPRCTVRRRHLARRRNANAVVRTSTTAKMVHAQTQLNVFFNAAILHFLHYHVAPASARAFSLYLRVFATICIRCTLNIAPAARAILPVNSIIVAKRERWLACASVPLLRA